MPSERVQRQIDRLLDQAEQALEQGDLDLAREKARLVLGMDSENGDALTYIAAVESAQESPVATASASAASPAHPSGPVASSPIPSAQPPAPTSFCDGRYQVVRFLGEGGKKRVFLAHDAKLDRDVAFALIKTDGLDDEGLLRIKREAQAMGRLGDHPHIVSVHDIGDEAGQPYLVSQLMPGGDVEGLVQKAPNHRLPLDLALRIADQLCQALEHAHKNGVVHRDLKPGNVWLTEDGTAKLGDFGLALALDRARLTQAGMMVGTVSYMPPEQALGGEVTPRSDLYSLGAMLYEMTTGRPPFVGDESVAIITQHLNTPPVAPSWHAPDLPPGLEALILRLLEKDPAKRPGSAAEVRQILAGTGTTALGSPVPQPPTPSPQSPLYRRTFVGREQELRQLEGAFDRAISGQGSLVAVVGEPGIGKTALCEQVATYVAVHGGRTLVGHCYEEGSLSLPYLGFVEAMRTYVLARPPDALRAELGTGATDVARIISEIRERAGVEPRAPGDPEDDRWRLLQAVVGFLHNAATVQPIFLVLEDLHWADRGTLDLLIHLARNLEGARLLVVGTYRDVEVDRAHPLSGALAELRRVRDFDRVPLRGLTADEVHRMINAMSGQDVRWGLAEAVHRQTEGNPLFVQEVLRYLVEEGLIVRKEGHWEGKWRATGDALPEMSIPEGLRDVIGKRLSKLGPDCNRLLAIASVVGRDFGLDTLQQVASLEEEPLVLALEEAMRVGVLEEQARLGTIRYRFSHALFRQTLYEELSAPRRLRLHQQIAQALEAQYAARLEDHAVELAEHFAQSTDRDDLAKAVAYSDLGAKRATAVYAYGEAVRLLEQALEVQEVLDPDDRARRCQLLLALGEALMPAGQPLRAAEEIASEAFALAETLGDERRAFSACRIALVALRRYGAQAAYRMPAFQGWADRADRYAAPGTVEQAWADLSLAQASRGTGQWQRSWVLGKRALELARDLADPEALFAAGQHMVQGGPAPGLEDEQQRVAEEIARRPRQGVSARTLGGFLMLGGRRLVVAGGREQAEALWHELEELGARTRDPNVVLYSLRIEAWRANLDGRLEEAVEIAKQVLSRGEELGVVRAARRFATDDPFEPLIRLGRYEEALRQRLAADEMLGTQDYSTNQKILCLVLLGRGEEAQAALAESLRAGGDAIGEAALGSPALLEAAVLLGDRNAAAQLSAHLAPGAGVLEGVGSAVGRILGAAAVFLGDPEEAKTYYERALDVCARARNRPETALTRLQLAELLLDEALSHQLSAVSTETGQGKQTAAEVKAEGLQHLDFAIAELRAMNMQPALARALRHKGLLHA